MAKSAKPSSSQAEPVEAVPSKFGVDAYAHAGSGDIKLGPNQPGRNDLPDGRIALTAKLIADMATASQDAQRRRPREHGRG